MAWYKNNKKQFKNQKSQWWSHRSWWGNNDWNDWKWDTNNKFQEIAPDNTAESVMALAAIVSASLSMAGNIGDVLGPEGAAAHAKLAELVKPTRKDQKDETPSHKSLQIRTRETFQQWQRAERTLTSSRQHLALGEIRLDLGAAVHVFCQQRTDVLKESCGHGWRWLRGAGL